MLSGSVTPSTQASCPASRTDSAATAERLTLLDLPLFAGLERASAILIAVSGGPDSMALMTLAAEWRGRSGNGAPSLHVATVDHGLRPEARGEAAAVALAAAALGLPHATLTWAGPKPTTGVQERARDMRYGLLAAHARHLGASHILTAHHADDQAETIMLRLGRGSGISGLAGMRRDSSLAPGITLTRPLLAVPKNELIAFCHARALVFVEDPSNRDPAFARARLRGQTRTLDALGLDRAALLRLARRMARADEALEAETDRLEVLVSTQRDHAFYKADLSCAIEMPAEILVRLIGRAVAHVVPNRIHFRLDRLEALAKAIRSALRSGEAHRATQGGARLVLGRDRLIVVRPEPMRRRGLKPTALEMTTGSGDQHEGRIDAPSSFPWQVNEAGLH